MIRTLTLGSFVASLLLLACAKTPDDIRDANEAARTGATARPGTRTDFGTEYGAISPARLRTGDCFDSSVNPEEPFEVLLVPCSGPWEHKVAKAVLVDEDGEWPGTDYFQSLAFKRCDLDFASVLFPSEDTWFLGDRVMLCLKGPPR